MREGIVIKSTGKFYTIKDKKNREILNATIRGKFKLQGFRLTNPVAVGDEVLYTTEDDGIAVIEHIQDRKNYVVRQSPRKKHYLHLMASNIDQAVLVVTVVDPNLKQGFIDRFLLMTEPYDIPVHIVFNKSDLYKEEDLNMYENLKAIYEAIGYSVLKTSVVNHSGFDALKGVLKEKISLISGQSGVGKSSLINIIDPSLTLKTNTLSGHTGKGQHTTTFAQMYELSDNSFIIDTPGIKTLSFNHLEVMDTAHNFREIFIASANCKYGDCTHRNEPSCEVKNLVKNGNISELRYFNYLQILDEIENQNYWERIKDY